MPSPSACEDSFPMTKEQNHAIHKIMELILANINKTTPSLLSCIAP